MVPRKVPPGTGRVRNEIPGGPYQRILPDRSVAIALFWRRLCSRTPSADGIGLEVRATSTGGCRVVVPLMNAVSELLHCESPVSMTWCAVYGMPDRIPER